MAESEVIRSLFVTLRRSYNGTPWMHKRILHALGLKKRHHCVEKPNNESIRGMLMKVPHLVIVETDKMFYLKRMKEYYEQLVRPPLVVQHAISTATTAGSMPQPVSPFIRHHLNVHVNKGKVDGFAKNWVPKEPSKYLKDIAARERVRALTKGGVYSQHVAHINQEYIKQKSTQYAPRESSRD